jgi:transposase
VSATYSSSHLEVSNFHGIDTLTGMLILAELHDFRRFLDARALMAYLGLVPED